MARSGKPYQRILISSIVITGLLFWYDYVHDNGSSQPLTQTLMEMVVTGALYVGAIFGLASLLYFCVSKLSKMIVG
jgi:hypothetical protein